MGTELAVLLLGISVGAAAIVIGASREYSHRRRREPGLHFGVYDAPATGPGEAVAPAAPKPAPSPVPTGFSADPPASATRAQLAPRRYGGSYVRRTAPKRSTATRQKPEDRPS